MTIAEFRKTWLDTGADDDAKRENAERHIACIERLEDQLEARGELDAELCFALRYAKRVMSLYPKTQFDLERLDAR